MITKSVSVVEILHILFFFLILHIIILPCLCSHMVYSLYFKQKGLNISASDEDSEVVETLSDLEDKIESEIVIVMMTSKGRHNYRQRTMRSVYREVSSLPERYRFFVCTGDSEGLDDGNIPLKPNMNILEPCKDRRSTKSGLVYCCIINCWIITYTC